MTESLQTALILMVIGMITVFVILFLVVTGGRLLILFVNRWFPLVETPPQNTPPSGSVPAAHIAVITAVTDQVTGGKGIVSKIEKIE